MCQFFEFFKIINKKLIFLSMFITLIPGRIAQSVTCLATDASLTADPGVLGQSRPGPILSWKLIMKYLLRSFSSLPLNHSRRAVVSYK